jgi:ribosomal protein S18 acetylase RimI-like enzyme
VPIEIRLLGPSDAAVLERVADDVFDHAIDARWAGEFFADDRHHIVVALDGDLVVGFASAVHYVHPDKPPELWINEVGVAPSHQRRGIGQQIMAAILAHGRSLGCREAWVGTEESNLAARALYGAAGGLEAEDRVVTFTFDLDDEPR